MKILFIIAPNNFRDEEYFIPRDIFFEKGFEVFVASTKKETAVGSDGGEAKVDFLIKDIRVDDYRAVVLIGGEGSIKYLDNEEIHNFLRKIPSHIILAAICISPLILLNAGVLKNKKATVWSSPLHKKSIKMLEAKGAFYVQEEVVSDGNIITASREEATEKFTREIIKNLTKGNI